MEGLKVPYETSITVQNVLDKDISVKEKAAMIYRYSKMIFNRKKGASGFGRPRVTEKEIEKILIDRLKNIDDNLN